MSILGFIEHTKNKAIICFLCFSVLVGQKMRRENGFRLTYKLVYIGGNFYIPQFIPFSHYLVWIKNT